MMNKYSIKNNILNILVLFLFSSVVNAEKLVVYTVNYPLQYFAERIGGENVSVMFPAPGNVDPAFWMPGVDTINAYQQADLILLNGAGYAKWVNKVSLPRRRLLNTSKNFYKKYIKLNNTVNHQHGPAGEHSHSGTAFTVWLDFSQAVMQSREILNALVRKRPEYKDEFESNFTTLKNDLLALDNQLFKITSKDPSKLLIASHPVYQYFARRYKLTINELMWEPDDYPSEMQWSVLTSLGNINWMIWEDQPTARIVAKLTELGLSVIVFRPCMNVPEQGDYMSVMQANVKHFSMAYP